MHTEQELNNFLECYFFSQFLPHAIEGNLFAFLERKFRGTLADAVVL